MLTSFILVPFDFCTGVDENLRGTIIVLFFGVN